MEIGRKWRFWCLLLGLLFLATTLQGVQGEVESEGPSESECRPYIEKALKELETADTDTEHDDPRTPTDGESQEEIPAPEGIIDDSEHDASAGEDDTEVIEPSETDQVTQILDGSTEKNEEQISETDEKASIEIEETTEDTTTEATESKEEVASTEQADEPQADEPQAESQEEEQQEQKNLTLGDETSEEPTQSDQDEDESAEEVHDDIEVSKELQSDEHETNSLDEPDEIASTEINEIQESVEEQFIPLIDQGSEQEQSLEIVDGEVDSAEKAESENIEKHSQETTSVETETKATEKSDESAENAETVDEISIEQVEQSTEAPEETEEEPRLATSEEAADKSEEEDDKSIEEPEESVEESEKSIEDSEKLVEESEKSTEESEKSKEEPKETEETEDLELSEQVEGSLEANQKSSEETESSEIIKHPEGIVEEDVESEEGTNSIEEETIEVAEVAADDKSLEELVETGENAEITDKEIEEPEGDQILEVKDEIEGEQTTESKESVPEEELTLEIEVPENLRPRDHIDQLLKLDDSEVETIVNRVSAVTLRDLKKLYESAIKPLETLYKYRDLSNRHFGDSEVFSKPLVLFMGPWSGGKSSIINYLLDNEYNPMSLRTGAEPSPAYFNLLMHGEEPEVLDGTQLAADFTFAGLQKFGQGLEERLRGLKLPSKLLEKINIVEIPGILEVRKQVSRIFPFNDACQWFIDRADIIFLVYDPSKLDVGPETEAILDQLKGREQQTRIILNKADQVKPEELMRVQSALIWNISPLMSSAQPPAMYTASLWSRPYEAWAPVRLLQAQERAFLRDLRSAVDKRIENKISSARRFAVRVRNHAKMVDCYLTTYYNHKSVFGNRKQVSDQIIEHPQDYHIYEGLSTLTNISRYDLPDPDVYKDFFRLNPLYDFQQLSATCTYFRGCPINRLDVAIAYDLPEMVGKHKKMVESALAELKTES